jgi:hypothetical protein
VPKPVNDFIVQQTAILVRNVLLAAGPAIRGCRILANAAGIGSAHGCCIAEYCAVNATSAAEA